jgi:pyruvate,water dikinase
MQPDSITIAKKNLVIPLSQITKAHFGKVGSKAANLGDMAIVGFPVPDGFVLTTDAFEIFLEENDLNQNSTYDSAFDAKIPSEIEAQLKAAYKPYETLSLAVRSSGISEDLKDASFAGQYETVLDVRGFEALISAIRRCWASVFSDKVRRYVAEKGMEEKNSMAVLVQRLVKADAAGVAFSANPVTGERDESVINAVKGLGERLVSGQSSPDEWTVRGDQAVSISSPEDAISIDQAISIAILAKKAEFHFGEPQDIEWVIEDGELYILQARPITALPEQPIKIVPVAVEPPPGFWERESEHFSEPLSPFFRSTIIRNHENAIFEVMEEYSMLIDGIQFREIGGWLYTKVIPLGGKETPPPPSWLAPILIPILIRVIPSMRKRVNGLVNVYRNDYPSQIIERWYSKWKPNKINLINQFKQVDPASLSDEQLKEHVNLLLKFLAENSKIHARLTGADILVADFILTSKRILGWDARKSIELLTGLSSTTTEPTKRLNDLVNLVKKKPELAQKLENITNENVKEIIYIDNDFAEAFEQYMKDHSIRTLTFEIQKKTLEERPELVLQIIRDHLKNNYDYETEVIKAQEKRQSMLSEAKEALERLSSSEQEEFNSALKKAERAYPAREDHEYYLHNGPLALLRKAILEVGNRLVSKGNLESADDVFFLELNEALSAFSDGLKKHDTVNRRKGELTWVKANPGPITYGGPPPPAPSMDGFPIEVKRVMKAMLWMIEGNSSAEYLQQKDKDNSQDLTGIAASPGQYTGPVRIVMNEEDFNKIKAGDILVCPTTQPPWSVLFPSVGALITDAGGILSHPAIIAREYKVPSIVATGNATKILKDDQIITVDGNTGQILIK